MSQPQLGRLILQDLKHAKLRWFLAIALMGSAFFVVQMAYENRQLTAQLEELKEQGDALNVEWRHLMLEEAALAEHSRVSQIASKELEMVRPSLQEQTLVDVR